MTNNPYSTSSISENDFAPLSSESLKFHLFGKRILFLAIGICFSIFLNAQVSKTVNLTTAGTLSTALTANELNSVTDLTITGTIDARDFRTMRDNMPILAVIDLGRVNIAAYHGNEVPNLWGSVDFPANTIPESAFYDEISQGKKSLTSVIFPITLTSIGQFAFCSCTGLNAITIPPLVTSIGTKAFLVCNGTTTISIPSSVTSIGENAFDTCSGLINVDANNLNYSSIDGVLFNKTQTTLIRCPTSKEGSYTIPSSVNSIGHDSFSWCTRMASVIIPTSVQSIEQSAFFGCSGMNSILIPWSVTSIEKSALFYCSGFINVDSNNQNYSSLDGVLFNKTKTSLIQCPLSKTGGYTIPSSVVTIESNAFENCTQLISVKITSSVQSIGFSAFSGCTGMTSLSIPSSVTTIRNNAFQGCRSLTSITVALPIPIDLNGNPNVFYDVNKTACKLYIPYGSSSLYASADQWKEFANIEEMPGFHLSATTANMKSVQGSTTTIDITANVTWTASSDQAWLAISPITGTGVEQNKLTFTAEANSLKQARTAKVTVSATGIEPQTITITQYGSSIEVTAGNLKTLLADQLSTITGVTLTGTIDARDFRTMRDNMPLLAALDLSGVNIAAYNGSEGTSIWNNNNYPANTIPESAFMNASYYGKIGLTSIVLPSSMTSFGTYSFGYCSGITAISIPSLVTDLGDTVFNKCTGLKSVSLPSSLIHTGRRTFEGCVGLTTVNIPSSVTTIGAYTFWNCSSLSSINIPSSVTSIQGAAFMGCTQLVKIDLPESVTSIENYAFYGCSGLTSFTIPPLVKAIWNQAFEGCTGLKSIIIPPLVTSIGSAAFKNCLGLTTISIPPTVTTIKDQAFANCSSLTSITIGNTLPQSIILGFQWIFELVDKNTCVLYVPYGTVSLYAAANIWKDFKNIVEPAYGLRVSSNTSKITAAAAGSRTSVDIISNVEWTASSDQSWLLVSPSKGFGNQNLTLTAAVVNPSIVIRKAVVTVSSVNFEPLTITVTQNGAIASLNLSPGTLASVLSTEQKNTITNLTLSGTMDARDFKTIRDNMPMLTELDLNAVTIAEYTGTEGTRYSSGSVNYPANTMPDQAFNKSDAPLPIVSVVLPYSITSFGYDLFEYDLKSLTVTCPVPFALNPEYSPFIYLNTYACILNVPYGTAALYKSVKHWKDFKNIVEASQGFNLSAYSLYVPGAEGSSTTSQISSNVEWTVSSDQDWLAVSPIAGNGAQTLTFTAKANPLFSTRTAFVTISGGGISQKISVKQEIQPQPLKTVEVTAGNLATVLTTDELNTLSKLTLTGTIDARDFKTMRDHMPYLAELDLSGVLVAAYTGTEGTAGTSIVDYAINEIPEWAFSKPSTGIAKISLTSIILPLSIISIGNYAFYSCTGLTGIVIPQKVKTIEYMAFYFCQSLASVVIPPSVTSIQSSVFGQCKALKEVEIPSSVTSIESLAFNLCMGLKTVTVGWQVPLVLHTTFDVFDKVDKNACTLNVPFGTSSRYAAANQWKNFIHMAEMPGFFLPETTTIIKSIAGSTSTVAINSDGTWTASSDQTWLNVSPSSGKGMGQKLTFTTDANQLSSTRTAKVTVSSTGMEPQTITVTQDGVPFIITPGSLATKLTTDELNTLTKLTLIGTIDARDFKTMRDKMPLLAVIDLSEATIVEYAGPEGPYDTSNRTYPANAIPSRSFYDSNSYQGKANLTTIIFPSSITSIGSEALMGCRGLTSINIPSSVVSIGSYAFYYCNMVGSIQANSFVPINLSSSNNVFYDLNTYAILKVPIGSKIAYQTSEQWKYFTNIEEIPGLFLSANSINLGVNTETAKLLIGSSSEWTAVSDQKWLTLNTVSGATGLSSLTLAATANTDTITRVATITVKASGFEPKILTVYQYSRIKVTAGNLMTLLENQLPTITNLTLTGSMDARDFKTIRDKMPLLTMLDISGATILEYTGKDGTGTYSYKSSTYPANTIPENAFYNSNKIILTTVILPPSLTAIGKYAFSNCSSLSNIDLPASVTSIGDGAFRYCVGMIALTIPSSVTTIGSYAFENCNKLTSIKEKSSIPPGLSLSSGVFYGVDKNICTLYVPFGTASRYRAAYQWKDFTNIVEDSEGFNVSSTLENLSYTAGSTASVTINANVNWNANSDQTWLSVSPAIGTGVGQKLTFTAEANPLFTSRTAYVTVSAPGVESQTITVTQAMKPQPPKALEITAGDFHSALTPLEFSTITNLSLTGTMDARDFKTIRENMPLLTRLDLSGVTIVAYNGPDGTSLYENTDYPENTIPECAFINNNWKSNKTISTLVFPESLTAFGRYSFYGCTGLNNVSLPSSVKDIGNFAFYGCSGLTTINITSKVTSIDIQAFGSFSGLITVDPDNLNFSATDGVLFNKTQSELIQCPVSKTGKYTIPSTVLSIGNSAFANCSALTGSLIIPSTVISIKSNAFFNCWGFKGTLSIPASVLSIESNAFSDCWGITTLSIPLSVTSIGEMAFRNCFGLSSIYAYSVAPINLNASKNAFSYINKTTCTLYVPYGSKSLYQMADQWKDFTNIVELNSGTIANAGPDQVINEGQVVILDGTSSKSNNNNNALSYKWTAPSGITLSSETASKPTFIAPEVLTETSFTFSLIINDGSFGSEADEVIIIVKQINKAPTANAGTDQSVNENSFVTLYGSASSDPDNDKLNYLWTAPAGITLNSETASNPSFMAPEVSIDTVYTFELIVNDGSINSITDQVKVTVKHANKTPIANAGTNQSVNENSLVTLDGSASSDPDQDELSYLWTAPAGISLSSETVKNPTFTAPEVSQDNIYRFILLVNDGKTDSDTSQVSIIVKQVLPVLKLVSKTSDSQIPSTEVTYQFYYKTGNSFSEESVTPVMNGDTTEFSIEPGEWIVLASPAQNSSTFVPTYSGNTIEWINAEHIIIPEKGISFKEITCLLPEIVNKGTGQISGYVYEKTDTGTKSISMTNNSKASGNPVPGALIQLFKKGNTVPVLSIFTDAQGYYKFDQLEVLDYQIVVEIPGFTQSERFGIAISTDQPVATAYFGVNTSSLVITDNNPLLLSSLKVYPNPVVRFVTVEVGRNISSPFSILVYSIDGELMINQVSSTSKTSLDFSELLAGTYLIQVCSGAERQSSIVIKR